MYIEYEACTLHAWHTLHNFQAASSQPAHSKLILEMVLSIDTSLPVIQQYLS